MSNDYIQPGWQVWAENIDYVRRVAAAQRWSNNEAVRRILAEAEKRRIFLPKTVNRETNSAEQE